jgi:polyferredoxin
MEPSLSITGPEKTQLNLWEKSGLALAAIATLFMFSFAFQGEFLSHSWSLAIILLSYALATGIYSYGAYAGQAAGIKNDHNFFTSLTARGGLGWILGIFLTGFYVLLYWYPTVLGLHSEGENTGIIALFDPLSQWIKGAPASQWFMYGTLYTIAILYLGGKFIYKYRHNSYHLIRTVSVMFFQLAFAFMIPEILQRLNQPYFDFKMIWPLDYYAFFDWRIQELTSSGQLGIFMLIWSIALILVVTPILTYFFGKRWYCSWVCGCGGLAETAGDPFRHLSDNSRKAWRVERWLIHAVLFLVVAMTAAVLYSFLYDSNHAVFNTTGLAIFFTLILGGGILWVLKDQKRFEELDPTAKKVGMALSALIVILLWEASFTGRYDLLFIPGHQIRSWYGFLIGATFSGVIGVGFYPIMGNRVWCRFGCPMAAILGIQQKFFSRFRITTNGNQCISCGNCSTYCEMGIDVKWYAQRGQDIVRASCVGCGICSAVCPRGVLRLENGPDNTNKAKELRALHIDPKGVSYQP